MMKSTFYEDIYKWSRGDVIPREYGLTRTIVNDIMDIGVLPDSYLSVFSMNQLGMDEFDTMFVDIDSHHGEDLHKNYTAVLDAFNRLKMKPTRTYFTGRGVHLYYDLYQPIRGKELYKTGCRNIIDYLEIKDNVDLSVIGNVRGMARIPNTLNTKSDSYMIMVNPEMDIEEMREFSKSNVKVDYYGENNTSKYILNFSKQSGQDGFSYETSRQVLEESQYPPCVHQAIDKLKTTGYIGHTERVVLASFLWRNHEGAKFENIIKYADDYKPEITKSNFDSIKLVGGYNYACKNIPHTICPFIKQQSCVFYPNLNKVFNDSSG